MIASQAQAGSWTQKVAGVELEEKRESIVVGMGGEAQAAVLSVQLTLWLGWGLREEVRGGKKRSQWERAQGAVQVTVWLGWGLRE